ncbi:hypothetical protein NW762_012924 [Fusarium torreyae]|uniref:Chromo domain-containing protein n=1 Tax=Fusarium torreyae TaxID=1237075 RepID=A0A9W8VAZ4_9HYPO|nr:hypothetical protein NW762_012924 [Fusarium torreyae]
MYDRESPSPWDGTTAEAFNVENTETDSPESPTQHANDPGNDTSDQNVTDKEDCHKDTGDKADNNTDDNYQENGRYYEIERLQAHQVDIQNFLVMFRTQWVGCTETPMEHEETFQADCANLVHNYWRDHGWRKAATDLNQYRIFRIVSFCKQYNLYEVRYVGYPNDEESNRWLTREELVDVAPLHLEEFENGKGT